MSAEARHAATLVRLVVLWGLFGIGGIVCADDAEAPDIEFLEYLGSWEASEEDWIIFAAEAKARKEPEKTDNENETAPNGEKLAELDDEN